LQQPGSNAAAHRLRVRRAYRAAQLHRRHEWRVPDGRYRPDARLAVRGVRPQASRLWRAALPTHGSRRAVVIAHVLPQVSGGIVMRIAALVLLAGCLEVPKAPGQECATNSDCNTAAGEVCDEGVCWGNPPTGMFAATVSPPAVREELVATEIPLLD